MTELDHTILAIIARDGPMSAYGLRKVFAKSLTPTWSSSAGSIYPAVRRLAGAGLVVTSEPSGGRHTQLLSISKSGRKHLLHWLGAITVDVAAASPDPIRTRIYFLHLLPAKERAQLLSKAQINTDEAIELAEKRRDERFSESSDQLQYLASEGLLYQLKARRAWLELLANSPILNSL